MGRAYDPAQVTRERLRVLEQREKARAEGRAVAEGVAESVALSRARGAKFAKEATSKGGRETPYRRMAGLEWLAHKGRISERQKSAGEQYGELYRRAGATNSIPSTWEAQPGGNVPGTPSLALVLKLGAGRAQAEAGLSALRERLLGQQDLIGACDLICGQELTPREAGGGDREGARVEAVLKVALDILILSSRT